MGKFCQFLTELSTFDTPDFPFMDDNLSNYQSSFTKLVKCIDIVEISGLLIGTNFVNF